MLRPYTTVRLPHLLLGSLCLLCVGLMNPLGAHAQDGQRWYQIEESIFANESSDLNAEQWPNEDLDIGFPRRIIKLTEFSDVLQLQDWSVFLAPLAPALPRNIEQQQQAAIDASTDPAPALPAKKIGPRPFVSSDSFTMPDLARDSFLALPTSAHDFSGTNRALERSANYRLLYHRAWRQPVVNDNRDKPIGILAGRQLEERYELEGSLRFYFNRSEDRVIFEPNIWLSSFTSGNDVANSIELPPIPSALKPKRVSSQPREMRSNEFHYVDHPAVGILVQITPYEPPAAIEVPQTDAELGDAASSTDTPIAPSFQ